MHHDRKLKITILKKLVKYGKLDFSESNNQKNIEYIENLLRVQFESKEKIDDYKKLIFDKDDF